MKKITIVIMFSFIGLSSAFAQWATVLNIPSNTGYYFSSVYFTDANTGYAIAIYGQIYKTTNAGIIWTAQTSGATGNLNSICFTDANNGYIAGGSGNYGGIMLKTTNAGVSWASIQLSNTVIIKSVYFTDANTGYAVGGGINGTISKTTDAGVNWTTQNVSPILNSVYFTDANNGYAVGASGNILKTTNAGIDWVQQTINNMTAIHFNSVYFTNASTGYIVGGSGDYGGAILKTTNSGVNWIVQLAGISGGLTHIPYSVFFSDIVTGYVVCGNGKIHKTTNGGTNWVTQESGTTHDLTSVYFTDNSTGYAVGGCGGENFGVILKYTNAGSWVENNSVSKSYFSISPNPANNLISIHYEDFQSIVGYSLKITNILGHTMYYSPINKLSDNINIENWRTKGIYFIHMLDSQNNIVENRKFMIQ